MQRRTYLVDERVTVLAVHSVLSHKKKFAWLDAAQTWAVVVATLSLADKQEGVLKVVLDL